MGTEITLSKFDAALDQLTSAIDLYFGNGKLVAVHTLAAAAYQVLHDLSEDSPHEGFDILKRVWAPLSKEKQSIAWKEFRKPQNFIKHAKLDKENTITLRECHTEYILLCGVFLAESFGIETSNKVTKEDRNAITAFKLWVVFKFSEESNDANFQFGDVITTLSGVFPFIPPLSPSCSRQEYYQWSKRVWGQLEEMVNRFVTKSQIESLLTNPKYKDLDPLFATL
ncbi:hypothetical protein [Pseudodesulfovibrio pelocollis]|uniref:hypothetical protein n=1 Tax=Pseudodesulfovibrio pelocollis TaxID=3051432 RepID=UPI00255AF599|nr:hypothetical protein [Pseudodesulfovibrio sp. SB368]